MKKIYGIFRGFPGLGRVSSGIALLKEAESLGYEIGAISYFQGKEALEKQEIPLFIDNDIEQCDITSIGLNPITNLSVKIIDKILTDKPEVVIVDGEPLLQSTLCDVYPKEKILCLLNPSDLHNDLLPNSTRNFYYKNYLSSGNAIVHGIGIEKNIKMINECQVHYIPTILRKEIIEIKNVNSDSKRIVGILGGGSVHSSNQFFCSTVNMGKKIVSVSKEMKDYLFEIYCNDKAIKKEIENVIKLPSNCRIVSSYTSPKEMYKNASLVIARAGRNVVSELLYLNIQGLLIATSGDYRSKEQEKNIDMILSEANSLFDKINVLDDERIIITKIKEKLNKKIMGNIITPGNEYAIEVVKKIVEEFQA